MAPNSLFFFPTTRESFSSKISFVPLSPPSAPRILGQPVTVVLTVIPAVPRAGLMDGGRGYWIPSRTELGSGAVSGRPLGLEKQGGGWFREEAELVIPLVVKRPAVDSSLNPISANFPCVTWAM